MARIAPCLGAWSESSKTLPVTDHNAGNPAWMLALVSAQLPKWDGEFRQGRSVGGLTRGLRTVGSRRTWCNFGPLWVALDGLDGLDGLEPGS